MGCQASSNLEEIGRFIKRAVLGTNQTRYTQRGAGKTECMTADQWLDQYAGWCEPFKARISPDACKLRRDSDLNDLCNVCKGIRKKNRKPAGGTCLPERILP